MSNLLFGHARLSEFALDPAKTHLNHGSYGAMPDALRGAQDAWRAQIRGNPTGFFRNRLPGLLREGAMRVAKAFGGHATDWVFLENATQGANAAIEALDLKPGDHVVATSEIYNAVRQALHHRAGRHGVSVEEVPIGLPVIGKDQIIAAFEGAIRPETRALFTDHISSNAALMMPVARIAALARAHGLACFVDGAHAPGQVEIDVREIGADWYVGNGHKWLCAPNGSALMWTVPEWQERTHPVVISHGYGSGYTAEFDWIGTRDPTAWLTIPTALDWHEAQGAGALRDRGRALARAMGERLAAALGTELTGPPEMQAAMAAVRLPGAPAPSDRERAIALDRDHDVVVSVNRIGDADWLRVSAALYNEASDVERVIEVFDDVTRQVG